MVRQRRQVLWAAGAILWLSALAGSLVGGLSVTTQPPGAQVYVGGELKGISPCTIPDVAIGEVEVKAALEGYATGRQTVQVKPDQVTNVQFELTLLSNVGHIVVTVEPAGSDVELDRVPAGKTPIRIPNVQAGTHHLKVSHDGHRPLHVDVTVITGKDHLVKGQLVEGGGWLEEKTAGEAEEEFGELDPDEIPLPDHMPEARAFEPVRAHLTERHYDEALKLLDNMAGDPESQKYMARITRDRRYVQEVKNIVLVGYKALAEKVGQDYPLLLRAGIAIQGKLLGVTDQQVSIEISGAGGGTQIGLDRIHIDRVIKLAAAAYPPDQPANQALFAILYAMEGEFKSAYEALRRAAAGGHNVTDARSYVESERLWAAAQEKARAEKEKAEREKEAEQKRRAGPGSEKGLAEPLVLIDRYRGGSVPAEMAPTFRRAGIKTREINRALEDEDLKDAAVLLIRDPGEGAELLPYTKAETKRIVKFVEAGGGLVFFGSPRFIKKGPQPRGTTFDALLLGQFKIGVRTGRMSVDEKAPRDFPRHHAMGVPAQRHPITAGINRVFFDMAAPAIIAPPASVILATPWFISSSATGRGPVPLASARPFGKGRVVAFCAVPDIGDEDTGADAVRMCVDAVRWAAYPKLEAARSGQ